MTGDFLELVDYISFAAVLAALPPLVPRQRGWMRRLSRAPIICTGLWLAVVLAVAAARDAFTGDLGWLLPAWLASVFFAAVGSLFYVAWLVAALLLSPQARRALIPYALYAGCIAVAATVILMADCWHGLLALLLLSCAIVGIVIRALVARTNHTQPKALGATESEEKL
ncbi:MAG: hypothetical protein ACYS4W_15250 [Planctomycetota bacterium]|jgi:hypothetical protein